MYDQAYERFRRKTEWGYTIYTHKTDLLTGVTTSSVNVLTEL